MGRPYVYPHMTPEEIWNAIPLAHDSDSSRLYTIGVAKEDLELRDECIYNFPTEVPVFVDGNVVSVPYKRINFEVTKVIVLIFAFAWAHCLWSLAFVGVQIFNQICRVAVVINFLKGFCVCIMTIT